MSATVGTGQAMPGADPAWQARRAAYDDGLADGFAACEALVVAGLQALAEAEDGKAKQRRKEGAESFRLYQEAVRDDGASGHYWIFWTEAVAATEKHETRAACLREMALAVSVGQFRTAGANEAAGEGK